MRARACYVAHVRTDEWDRETFRKVLEDIQDRTHLTEADLATLAGRSRSQVNRWTRAENQPAHAPLIRLVGGLEKFGPAVRKLGIELLAAAGYAPPEPVAQVSQVDFQAPEHNGPGVRVEQYDERHLRTVVVVDTNVTMDEAIASLGDLSDQERTTVYMLRGMEYEPAEVAGAVLLLRGLDARRARQRGSGRRSS
jgi:transcriptional regulator with XRE-family HTH domain